MVQDPFLGPQHLPEDSDRLYVGWLDLMGVGDAMSRSYPAAATNIGKLFAAVANHRYIDEIEVYPMADGMYLLGEVEDEEELYVPSIMSNIFRQFGNLTYKRHTDTTDSYGPWLGFLLRGGIAYGDVYHGSDVDESDDSDIAGIDWLDNIPFGEPIANAHNVEIGGSPYGIRIHDSVPTEFASSEDWQWWTIYDDDTKENIVDYLEDHFEWCLDNIDDLTYQEDRLYVHAERAEEYFNLGSGYFDF